MKRVVTTALVALLLILAGCGSSNTAVAVAAREAEATTGNTDPYVGWVLVKQTLTAPGNGDEQLSTTYHRCDGTSEIVLTYSHWGREVGGSMTIIPRSSACPHD